MSGLQNQRTGNSPQTLLSPNSNGVSSQGLTPFVTQPVTSSLAQPQDQQVQQQAQNQTQNQNQNQQPSTPSQISPTSQNFGSFVPFQTSIQRPYHFLSIPNLNPNPNPSLPSFFLSSGLSSTFHKTFFFSFFLLSVSWLSFGLTFVGRWT